MNHPSLIIRNAMSIYFCQFLFLAALLVTGKIHATNSLGKYTTKHNQ